MAEYDDTLKTLINSHSEAFMAWLLGQPPKLVRELNSELALSTHPPVGDAGGDVAGDG